MIVKSVYTILKIATLIVGLLVSGCGFLMSYDAANLQLNPNDFANNFSFQVNNGTVYVETFGIIKHNGYAFSFSNLNITVILAVNSPDNRVAQDMKIYTINPKDEVNVTIDFEIPYDTFTNATSWYISIFVHGYESYSNYNFAEFQLTTTKEVS